MLFKLINPVNNCITHCGVLEFLPNNEPICYLPHWMMSHLSLEEGDEIHVESVHSIPTASFVRFQPQSNLFLDITNPKAVLEKSLRSFSCLTKGDLISINYLNRNYQLLVLELKPADVVSIIDCDMEVDFAPALDSIPTTNVNQDKVYINPTTLLPFQEPGICSNGKTTQEKSQLRGIPNYDYKYGLLEFPRQPLRSLNDDINETLEKNSSSVFQPFTGEGKILRQPRNQRPK